MAPHAMAAVSFSLDDAAELCGRLAALSRAGLPGTRVWQVLADARGPGAQVAGTVAGMLAVGGSIADGLQLAADTATGPGVEALGWLVVTAAVIERSGAPSALVFDTVATGLLAQLAELDDLQTALAGPRATATVLASLPLAGLALGLMMGINPVAALTGSPIGWACAGVGGLLWIAGRRWSSWLIAGPAGARGSDAPSQMPASLVLELLAAVLRGGAPPPGALRAVGAALASVGDSRSDSLLQAAAAVGHPDAAAARAGLPEPAEQVLSGVQEELLLAARSGLPPAVLIQRAAAEQRRRAASVKLRAVRRLEVLLVLPSGLCLLPAFVMLGVVPLVLALLTGS